ncbi:hypothetical protein [Streptomyces sp. NPDC018833]|uniref:hypothetical protein n=1 Tax=Streptomyces sp. NPDC018833 TaxID=3365053 RepID=UPI0037A272F1
MTRDWRTGSIELVDGYTLSGADGRRITRADDVRFAIEGGFVNIRLPEVPHIQVVSAPAVRLITGAP